MALATGGLVAGCDSDAKIAKSAAGESCDKTSDCNDGLKCLEGTCYKSSSTSTGGSANNEGGEGNTAGSTVVGPKPPVLGGEGESCTKRADCEDGLACLSQRCQKDGAMGMGGEGSGGPTLGGPGETCGLTSDCGPGLACLPTDAQFLDLAQAKASGSNSVGVCTPLDSGIAPTGKSCYECAEAADCCELPIAEQAYIGVKSCTELATLVDAVPNCDTATLTAGRYCLDYSVYCTGECAKNTWACDAGQCQYTAKCTKAGTVVGGCPAYTRTGNAVPACDTKAGKCAPLAGCKKDTECNGGTVLVFDDATDYCADGECTCHVASGHCYRKCSEDLDCPNGYMCDADTSVCVQGDSCSSDAQCAVRTGDIRQKCVAGACKPSCEHDVDCNNGGLHGGFSQVCGPDKTCIAVGCTDDSECALGEVRRFCADSVEAPTGTVVRSAITD
jgi:hypothetical protein